MTPKTTTAGRNRILAEGISVSNDTRQTGVNNNDLIIGSSGSGKTGGYVIPNIQNIDGSLVVSDTKGILHRMFSSWLRSQGYDVQTIDLVTPENSCGYNPLDQIRRYPDGSCREQDILTLADVLMPRLDQHEPFWEDAAAGYLSFLIAYCMEALPPEDHNMLTICRLHRTFMLPGGRTSFLVWTDSHPETFASRKYGHLCGSASAEKMWSSILEFATRALEPFEFREAAAVFGKKDNFDLRTLGTRRTVLFLNVSDTDRALDRFVNIIYTQTLQILCAVADATEEGRLPVPVRIIMDDFATSARIPDFDKIISVIRSRDISVSLVLQSMAQLNSMYGKAAATTIINNCDHLLYLGTQDVETAEYIAYRAMKTPDTVLTMPREKAYLLTNGEKAALVNKVRPYSTMKAMKKTEQRSE